MRSIKKPLILHHTTGDGQLQQKQQYEMRKSRLGRRVIM